MLAGCMLAVLALLWIERLAMGRIRSAIPVRIVVVGTRGKTSVTRLIAAGLRAGGLRVLAKTTGSEPRAILPTGDEKPIRRRGMTTPLEQRRILLWGANRKCDAVVIEGMSIRPESLSCELKQIIRPQRVVITNTYEDHTAETSDPAAVFAEAVPEGATVFLPSDFPDEERHQLTRKKVSTFVIDGNEALQHLEALPTIEWPQNLALALAVCDSVGVSVADALQGMAEVHMDVGQLGAWNVIETGSLARWMAVSGFAANDPVSTMAVLKHALKRWPAANPMVVGLLNLRRDRGDRTLQWMQALDHDASAFDRMIVCGFVPWTVCRKLERTYGSNMAVVRSSDPQGIMRAACKLSPEGGTLFGFGNIGGAGVRMLNHWQDTGEPA